MTDAHVTHVFDAPREEVFGAWTDPEQVARWWAPDGFHVPSESVTIEPRVGGRFELAMAQAGGDGVSYPYRARFVELVEPELIVLEAEPVPGADIERTVLRVVFEALGERTRMTVTSGPYTEEMRTSAEAGLVALMGNLERLLAA
jgi:uncharacterized protein YndB with AHSA1/START domain